MVFIFPTAQVKQKHHSSCSHACPAAALRGWETGRWDFRRSEDGEIWACFLGNLPMYGEKNSTFHHTGWFDRDPYIGLFGLL